MKSTERRKRAKHVNRDLMTSDCTYRKFSHEDDNQPETEEGIPMTEGEESSRKKE